MSFFDFLDPIFNAFSGGGGSASSGSDLSTFVEPAATGVSSVEQAPSDFSGLADIAGGAPAAIGAANPAMFGVGDVPSTSAPSSFQPTGTPPALTGADIARNPALGQLGGGGGGNTQAQVGGITRMPRARPATGSQRRGLTLLIRCRRTRGRPRGLPFRSRDLSLQR